MDNLIRDKSQERYCSVYESLDESLKEVKEYKAGKIHFDTWDELYQKLKNKEKNRDNIMPK